jgi:hypothetical protein
VTQWIGDKKAGELQALLPLWDRYYALLVERARAKLRDLRGPRAVHDEEDLALLSGVLEGPIHAAAGAASLEAAGEGDRGSAG